MLYNIFLISLHHVFHGIRFILRLVKIACREISNFFMSAVPAGMTLAHTVLIFVAGLLVLLPTVFILQGTGLVIWGRT